MYNNQPDWDFVIDCDEIEYPYLIDKETTIKMDILIKDLESWFKNPYLLYNHTERIMTTRLFNLFKISDKPDNIFHYKGQDFNFEDPTHRALYEKYCQKYDRERVENRMKDLYDEGKYKKYSSNSYTLKLKKVEKWDDSREFELETFGTWKKGTSLQIVNKNGFKCCSGNSFLSTVFGSFNIITKEFKLMEINKRNYYQKFFSIIPFTAFEECGIEVIYARKGYSIDGKRLPSFNRGSIFGLKKSLRENKIKLKGLTKKDDMIKALLKL